MTTRHGEIAGRGIVLRKSKNITRREFRASAARRRGNAISHSYSRSQGRVKPGRTHVEPDDSGDLSGFGGDSPSRRATPTIQDKNRRMAE